MPLIFAAAIYVGGSRPPPDFREIERGGTGAMLIRRHVLEKLRDVVPAYANADMRLHDENWRDAGDDDSVHYEFFPVGVFGREYLSEDYAFCRLAREQGFRIYASPGRFVHVGTHVFAGGC